MASPPKSPADAIDASLVRQLADILTDTGLSEIEVERGGLKIRVAKTLIAGPVQYAAASPAPAPAAPTVTAPAAAAEAAPVRRSGDTVTSPMVGTVYLQPEPGSPAFVKVGDSVEAGQTLFIVEAMKTMNPIPAPKGGRIVEILVGDAQPVEFGAPLAVIE